MSKNQRWQLADELGAELNEFLKLKIEIADAQSRFESRSPDLFEIRAIGSILHDVYQNAENILQRVAKRIDRNVPISPDWHRALLDRMAAPLPQTRPAVIQSNTANRLDDYRRFRHLFRNIYGFKLEWVQMKPLLANAPAVIDRFGADIEQFIAFLRLMSEAEDSE